MLALMRTIFIESGSNAEILSAVLISSVVKVWDMRSLIFLQLRYISCIWEMFLKVGCKYL